MAALVGCGIHNALVEVDGPEVPIMDGSSDRFVREILSTGIQVLDAPVRVIRVLERVEHRAGDVSVSIEPFDCLEIDFSIDFPDAAIGKQNKVLNMAKRGFRETALQQPDVLPQGRCGLDVVPGSGPWRQS